MGLFIALEKENGDKLQEVEDSKNILHRILPSQPNDAYRLIQFIDWYGDTTFNRIQIDTLLNDLNILESNIRNKEEIELVQSIKIICTRCLDEPHLYVKFYGD